MLLRSKADAICCSRMVFNGPIVIMRLVLELFSRYKVGVRTQLLSKQRLSTIQILWTVTVA